MSEARRRWERARARRRAFWTGAALAAAAAHLGLLWVAGRMTLPTEPDYPQPFVSFPEVSAGREAAAWIEQGLLLDPAPLLLPTVWNAAVDLGAGVRVPTLPIPFGPFPEQLAIAADTLAAWSRVGAEPSQLDPANLWAAEPWDRWGVIPSPDPPARPGGLSVTIRSGLDGREVATLGVPASFRPAETGELWAPAEFLFFVAEGGRLGFPLLVSGSGVAAVDARLREFLAGATALGALPPGYYRVTIGL